MCTANNHKYAVCGITKYIYRLKKIIICFIDIIIEFLIFYKFYRYRRAFMLIVCFIL